MKAKGFLQIEYLHSIYPGAALCVLLGFGAKYLDTFVIPGHFFLLNYVLLAIIMGLLARNLFSLAKKYDAGIEFCTKICLYIGIVLLGAGLNLAEIFSIGLKAILMVAISITISISLCGWMAKKIGAGQRWGHLLGAGIGICGVSAIIAMAPVIKAREREIITAIGSVLIIDIMVLAALPSLGHTLGWGDSLAGFIAGVVPANTAQCIAIGHAYSGPAGTIATIVKSARNALLPLVILVMTFVYTLRGLPVGEKVRPGMLWHKFPKFIVGLLIAATLSTLGLIPAPGIGLAKNLSVWFFVVCFAGIGASINLKELGGQILRVAGLGIVMMVVVWFYAYLYSVFVLSF